MHQDTVQCKQQEQYTRMHQFVVTISQVCVCDESSSCKTDKQSDYQIKAEIS